MRLPLIVAVLALSVPAAARGPVPASPAPGSGSPASVMVRSTPVETDKCHPTRSHFANRQLVWKDGPVRPKKLDELPRATAYMAVWRHINGCEMPMTVAEYRDGSSR